MISRRMWQAAFILLIVLLAATQAPSPLAAAEANRDAARTPTLSPVWGPSIRQWEPQIAALSTTYGFDPDFIAAVIMEDAMGDYD